MQNAEQLFVKYWYISYLINQYRARVWTRAYLLCISRRSVWFVLYARSRLNANQIAQQFDELLSYCAHVSVYATSAPTANNDDVEESKNPIALAIIINSNSIIFFIILIRIIFILIIWFSKSKHTSKPKKKTKNADKELFVLTDIDDTNIQIVLLRRIIINKCIFWQILHTSYVAIIRFSWINQSLHYIYVYDRRYCCVDAVCDKQTEWLLEVCISLSMFINFIMSLSMHLTSIHNQDYPVPIEVILIIWQICSDGHWVNMFVVYFAFLAAFGDRNKHRANMRDLICF